MIAALLSLAFSASLPDACLALPGAREVLAGPQRWIIVGEVHGTAEAPAAFGDLVCHAGSAKPVVAAVEQPESDQPLIDAYMASDGGEAARAALLKGRMWTTRDGRSSVAYLALFETLRLRVRDGRVSRVVAFQPVLAGSFERAAYEVSMAELLRAASPDAGTRVVALVGNVHAMLEPVNFGGTPYMPAAGLLPMGAVLTFNVSSNGGTVWSCTREGCGVHQNGRPGPGVPRGIVLVTGQPWSGLLNLGVPSTASPPVAPR